MTDLNKNKKICMSIWSFFEKFASAAICCENKVVLFLLCFFFHQGEEDLLDQVLDQGGKSLGGRSRSGSVSFLQVQHSKLRGPLILLGKPRPKVFSLVAQP